jgi:competence protein ComEC
MLRSTLLLAGAFIGAAALSADAQTARTTLDIYITDVEGGNGTLIVAPSGESLLIDTGNANGAVRDAERIYAAAKDAGLTQIDHLILTHYHGDHFGGMAELQKRIPIKEFIDHGPNVQTGVGADWERDVYPKLYAQGKHTVAKAGDKIPMRDVDITVITSAGETIQNKPLRGAGRPNPYCAGFMPAENNAEDVMSVGIFIQFGRFRTAHFGDITKNKEHDLMCPNNPIGQIDVDLGLHHGQSSSNSQLLIHAITPRVGLMNNGTRKGGEPDTMRVVHSSPGFEDLWQIHFSQLSGQEYTTPGMFIANGVDEPLAAMPIQPISAPAPGPAPVHNGPAYWLKLTAKQDGSFTVTNQRNGYFKTYAARP